MRLPRLLVPDPEPLTGSTSPEKFEDLLGRLEQIVSDMENAELPLEKLLSSYEEGVRLVKTCGDRLLDAEQKVEILSRGAGPMAPSVPPAPAHASDSSQLGSDDTALSPTAELDDNIRLT